MKDHTAREAGADEAAVDAVVTASRSLIAVATRSLGAAAEETTIAQYRTQEAVARALRAFADAAGEIPDSKWPAAIPGRAMTAPRPRPPVQPGRPLRPVMSGRADATGRA